MIDISYPYRLEVIYHAESLKHEFGFGLPPLSIGLGHAPAYREYHSDIGLSDLIQQVKENIIYVEFDFPIITSRVYIEQAKYYIRDVYSGTVKNILDFT